MSAHYPGRRSALRGVPGIGRPAADPGGARGPGGLIQARGGRRSGEGLGRAGVTWDDPAPNYPLGVATGSGLAWLVLKTNVDIINIRF